MTQCKDLYLKVMDEDDLPDVCEIRNECIDMLHGEPRTLEQTKEWFKKEKPMWFIIKKKEYDLALLTHVVRYKTVGYFRTKLEGSGDYNVDIQVGCDIHPHYRRQGIAEWAYTEMIERLIFNHFTPTLYVLTTNQPAINLYKKLGFQSLAKIDLRRKHHGLYYTNNQDDWQTIDINNKQSYYLRLDLDSWQKRF